MRSLSSLLLFGACLCIVKVLLPTISLAQYTIKAHGYSGYTHDGDPDDGLRRLSVLHSRTLCGTIHLKSFTVRVACEQSKFSSSSVALSGWRARRAKSLATPPPPAYKQWIVTLRDSITPQVRSSLERVLSQKLHTYLPDLSFLVWATSAGTSMAM